MKQIIIAIILLSFSVVALALSPEVLWTASDTKLMNNTARTGVPPVVQLELTDSGDMLLNWAALTGATGYNVYHANAPGPIGSDAWTVLVTLPPETVSYMVDHAQTRGFFYVSSIEDDGPEPGNFVFVAGGTVAGLTVDDFYVDKYEVTQEAYMSVMGTNPSANAYGPDYPVNNVSWYNAIEYCNRRSIDEGLTPCYSYSTFGTSPDSWPSGWNVGQQNQVNVECDFSANGYRLLREAEWEYAARAGLDTNDYTYSGSNDLDEVAWWVGNNTPFGVKAVGTKLPNELGLYDMSGNATEWCWNRTSGKPARRGGSYSSYAVDCTVIARTTLYAQSTSPGTSFRLCRSTP